MKPVGEPLFMTEAQVDDFTEIRRGQKEKTKFMLQCDFLRKNGISHFVSARGKPRIPLSVIEGRSQEPVRKTWQPRIA